jgi:hypothetical protein
MNITADIDTKTLNISAAIDNLHPATKHLMASAGVDLGGKKITVGQLDAQFRASPRPLSAENRLAIKISLERASLLTA